MIFALFSPDDELTAILRIIAIVIWVLAAFFQSNAIGKKVGGQDGMVALGLAVWFFPGMWLTVSAAF